MCGARSIEGHDGKVGAGRNRWEEGEGEEEQEEEVGKG